MVLLSPPPLIASVNAGPEEAKNLAEGRILRLTQIRFDNGGPRLTCLLDLCRTPDQSEPRTTEARRPSTNQIEGAFNGGGVSKQGCECCQSSF